ncbi:MAG: hypothetical protein SFV54_05785 [Bryobacteraceae bacterium]|nr:hypothetical protein [Bryobacteraceae bacterium]
MFVEFAAFLGLCGIFYAAGAGRSFAEHRCRKQTWRELEQLSKELRGQPASVARERLGEPAETVEGLSGRQLLIWKEPRSEALAVITATVDQGRLVDVTVRLF